MANAKERAAANAAKKANKSTKAAPKEAASKSFNYKALGISADAWAALGPQGQSAMSVIGAGVMKIVDKNQPLPEVLDQKEMNELWKQAEADPAIAKQYGDEMNVAKDYLNKNVDLLSAEFKSLTEDQQRAYIDAKKAKDEAQAAAGTAYSGFAGQAKTKLDTQQSGIVESSRRQLQSQLNAQGQQFEQRFGSAALGGTKLGTAIGGGDIGTYGGQTYDGSGYTPVSYTATGGIGGTQAQDILASKLQKQQDLSAEEIQSIQLDNIQREKNQAKALSKLNV